MLPLNSPIWYEINYTCSFEPAVKMPSLIKELQSIENDESSNEYFNETLESIRDLIVHQSSTCTLTIAVIPYLTDMFVNNHKHSRSILWVLWESIIDVDERDLNRAHISIKNGYTSSVEKLYIALPLFIQENISVLNNDDKTIAVLLYLYIIGERSKDYVIRSEVYAIGWLAVHDFEECEIDNCPHCNSYIHVCFFNKEMYSFTTNSPDVSDIMNITPKRFVVGESKDWHDDMPTWLYTFLYNINETSLFKALPLIYGKCICPHCNKEVKYTGKHN